MPSLLRSSALAAVACAAAFAGVAAPASAESISYVKDGNVFLTTPDGSRTFQVTSTGAYSYASQADDGTIIALTGENLHKLDRLGNVVADFKTPVSDGPVPPGGSTNPSANYFVGPFDPEISPDGTKVAYTYYWQHYTFDPTCGYSGCMRQRLDSGVAISQPDRLTAWDEFGGNLSGWVHPYWISSEELLRSEAGVPLAENAVVNRVAVGGGGELDRWFRHGYYADYRDMALTRAKDKLAMVVKRGNLNDGSRWYIEVWRTPQGTDAVPTDGCFSWLPDDGSDPEAPAWSADGTRLAFTDGEGLHVLPVPDQSAGCATPTEEGPIVAPPGARYPHWSAAGVPTERPKPVGEDPVPPSGGGGPVGGGGGGGGSVIPDGGGTSTDAPKVVVSAPKRAKLADAIRRGVALTVAAPGAGKVNATAKVRGKVVGRGTATASKAGSLALRLKVAKALKAKKAVTLNVAVTFTPQSGGVAVTRTVAVKLAR